MAMVRPTLYRRCVLLDGNVDLQLACLDGMPVVLPRAHAFEARGADLSTEPARVFVMLDLQRLPRPLNPTIGLTYTVLRDATLTM
jgi:hypothetical protein